MACAAERQRATFSPDALLNAIHAPKALLFKRKMEEKLAKNPLFDRRDDVFLSRPQYLKKAVERSFETYKLLKEDKELLAMHSPLHGDGGAYVGQMGTPTGLSDHFALFVATLLSQGSAEQQREWVMKSVNLQIIGTYAQTELGHGSNVRALETTATYEEATDSFIIDSPTIGSAKWWPGALGLLATHAVLYARLIIKEQDLGFHAFVVPLRGGDLKPLPGVEVGDVGPKLGYNAYDSGYLKVSQLRVPRFNMLSRFQQVEKGGRYISAPKGLQKIAYLTMVKTRVFIAHHSAFALAKVLTIAVRYGAVRKQGFVDSKKAGLEQSILDHQIVQDRLFPLVGLAYANHFAGTSLYAILAAFDAKLKAAKTPEAAKALDTSLLPVLHATAAGLKAFTTQWACSGMEDARKCCGGHGYTLNTGIGGHMLTLLPSVTYEGDMVPMALQTARFLVKCAMDIQRGKALPAGNVAYLAKPTGTQPVSVEDFQNPALLLEWFYESARRSVKYAVVALMTQTQKLKGDQGAAWIATQVPLYRAALAHTLVVVLEANVAALATLTPKPLQQVMAQLAALFALEYAKEFGHAGILTSEASANAASAKAALLAAVRPNAVALVDGFAFSDFELNTTIGNFNNDDLYERMVDAARRNPLNTEEYQRSFHAEFLAPRLSKLLLRNGNEMPKAKL